MYLLYPINCLLFICIYLILQTELDRLKHTHETKMAEAKEELKSKLNQLSKDLDGQWTDTLRY